MAASGAQNPGAALRVVSDDGRPAARARTNQGCSRSKPAQLGGGTDWMRTTDLARIDADGFLWILGRADQAIIARGGFR